jgi:N-methylhydantoinase A
VYRIAIDVGGTFTDCLVLQEATGEVRQFKAPTTPADPSIGLMDALEKASVAYDLTIADFVAQVGLLIHGTTLATNTLINKDGATTGMVTTREFADVIEIRRGYKNVRTSMYNVFVPPYEPLVPRRRRLEVTERSTYEGEVVTDLNEADVRSTAEQLRTDGVESVAICFLHSYAAPQNERRAQEIVQEILPNAHVVTSHDILPVWREWERFSTTVVSAYVGPVVERYLEALESRLQGNGFDGTLLMMLSDGLVETIDRCRRRAVYLIGSGPAAAPAAAIYAGETAGYRNVLSFDMGGTSIDIGVIMDAEVPTTTENWAGDERVGIKMVDIHSAGAGGGSIAWIDSLGLLRVGPQSAGSYPGPACYGNGGTLPTTTDADVVLGFVDPDYFLGGEITLDRSKAEEAVRVEVAEPLGMTGTEGAQAILTAVSSFVADQISEVFTSRGLDVRDIAIVAGGGAGPVHAAFIAERLSVPTVIVPSFAATFSAFGMFAMDIGRNFARSYISSTETADLGRITNLFQEMEDQAANSLKDMDAESGTVEFVRTVAMRYIGQFSEVEVSFPLGEVTDQCMAEAVSNFHRRHEELYTFQMPWKGTEFLTFYLKATVQKARFELQATEEGSADASSAQKSTRECIFNGVPVETPVYDGSLLRVGNRFEGPAIVEEAKTTVVVPPRFTCEVNRQHGYVLNSQSESLSAGAQTGEDR